MTRLTDSSAPSMNHHFEVMETNRRGSGNDRVNVHGFHTQPSLPPAAPWMREANSVSEVGISSPTPTVGAERSATYIDHYQDEIKNDNVHLFESLVCGTPPPDDVELGGVEVEVKLQFPSLLYKILSETSRRGEDNIIAWSPHGRSFSIHNRWEFIHTIMPR